MQHDLKRLSNNRAPGTSMIHNPSTSIRSSGERMPRRYCGVLIHAEGKSRNQGLYATGTKLAAERVHTPPGIRRYSRNRLYIIVYGMLGILRCLYECASMFPSSLETVYIICSFLVRDAWRSVGCEILWDVQADKQMSVQNTSSPISARLVCGEWSKGVPGICLSDWVAAEMSICSTACC